MMRKIYYEGKTLEQRTHKGTLNRRLGIRIRFLREHLQYKQSDIADRLGITLDRYEDIESGWTTSDFSILVRILQLFQYFGLTFYDIFEVHFNEIEWKTKIEEHLKQNKEKGTPIPKYEKRDYNERICPINTRIGMRLMIIRSIIPISRDTFSNSIGIKTDRLYDMEKGKVINDLSILVKIVLGLKVIDVTIDDFLCEDERFDKSDLERRIRLAREQNYNKYNYSGIELVVLNANSNRRRVKT